uniref:Lysophosphatidylserine lipase ABHD12 n=1 Tax=Rhabditophanes sp. KR3021 TaxID=114890 RepID=A0AC35UFR2_9BILA
MAFASYLKFIIPTCFLLTYGSLPVIIYFKASLFQELIFLSFMNKDKDIRDMRKHGIKSKGRSFYLSNRNGKKKVGAYHLLPKDLSDEHHNEILMDKDYEDLLKDSQFPVVIYFHGIKGCRSNFPRVALYNKLTNLNCHVIAIDYQGFGDSDGKATEDGMVESAIDVCKYVNDIVGNKFYIWGHSFGTGISLKTAAILTLDNIIPSGIVLESAFSSLKEVLNIHYISKLYNWSPFILENMILDPFTKIGLTALSTEHILKTDSPILMLHAEDDTKIPICLNTKLFNVALDSGKNVQRIIFPKSKQFGHCSIYKSEELNQLLPHFFLNCYNKQVFK